MPDDKARAAVEAIEKGDDASWRSRIERDITQIAAGIADIAAGIAQIRADIGNLRAEMRVIGGLIFALLVPIFIATFWG